MPVSGPGGGGIGDMQMAELVGSRTSIKPTKSEKDRPARFRSQHSRLEVT